MEVEAKSKHSMKAFGMKAFVIFQNKKNLHNALVFPD